MDRYALAWSLGFFGFKFKFPKKTEHTDPGRGGDSLSYP